MLDKKKNKITIVEIGVTNKDRLKTVETEKLRKYDLLKKELAMIHKCEVEVIPYVITWDGLVTRYHKIYRTRIGLDKNVEAYVQSLTLKKNFREHSFGYVKHYRDAKD